MISLYDTLNESYKSNKDANRNLGGYMLDQDLSNDNHKVYYNKDKARGDRVLVSYRGTSNLNDIGTDAYLALGKLRDTNRFKQSDEVLHKAKHKYNEENAILAGHSLGNSLARATAKKHDKVIGYNAGNGIFGNNFNTKTDNERSYRTGGDWISLLSNKKTKTLKNKNWFQNALNNHTIENIKHEKLFI